MLYNTRHLVAKRQLTHGDQLIEIEGEFSCSPVDEDFYLRKGWAALRAAPPKPGPDIDASGVAASGQPAVAPKRRGRPPKAVAAEAPESASDEAASEADALVE